jgi:5,6,7,8-tetrahydromethanopterin hydro-lyase
MSTGTSTVTTTSTSGPGELPVMAIGESFVGEGAEAAHLNTVLGRRDGPVGTAWATALATPRAGHTPFIAVVKPGLPAKPITLFVNKASIASPRHGDLTWGAAQAGVAAGVCDAVAAGVIDAAGCDDLVLIAAVWVNPEASEAELVYQNNRAATLAALRAGAANLPQLSEVLPASAQPANPYFPATGPSRGTG